MIWKQPFVAIIMSSSVNYEAALNLNSHLACIISSNNSHSLWKYDAGLEWAAVEDTVLFSFLKPVFVTPKQ